MKKVLKISLVVVVLLAAGFGYYLWRSMPNVPDRPFASPSGSFGVGTREYDWTDASRAEPYTKASDDHRRIAVQVWYPVERGVQGDTARWVQQRDAFASRLGAFVARKATTNSILEAPLAGGGPFPVLVYNHGGAWTRWSATFATEWLASHGYVVFSVEHFGFNQSVKYLDGSRFAADTLVFPTETGDGKQDALASWAYLDDPVFLIWKGDAAFALDQIERLNQAPGPFSGRLDLDRVGMFGWSFGGALSMQMSAEDPRVKAAVDHDGQLFGDVRERGTARPVMQFHHGIDDALGYPEEDRPMVRELMADVDSWDSTARTRSTADWYDVTIAGTDHGHFSDLVLIYPGSKEQIDPRRGHEIINAYTLAFFDQYLKGVEAPLLSAASPPDPEATLKTRPAAPVAAQPD